MKLSRSFSIMLICIVLGIMIAWQYKSIYNNSKLENSQVKRLEDLKDEIIKVKNENEDLRKRSDELIAQNSRFENAKGNMDMYEKNLKSELERARIIAGLVDVKGNGLIITISNSEYANVEEIDLLNLLNELRATDAQAISVNEERIIATSEIRKAGGYIVINGEQMVSPFTIKVIADSNKVENALKMIGGIIENLEVYKLKVNIEKKDGIIIPKVRDDGSVIRTDLLQSVNK